jgi:predicted TIM-barrel fold metal-dependent hydrolase
MTDRDHVMERHIVISVDGHVFAPAPANSSSQTRQLVQLDQYFDRDHLAIWQEYRAALSRALAPLGGRPRADDEGMFAKASVGAFERKAWAQGSDASDGLFDSDVRTREMESQGICAEVLFPNVLPFSMPEGGGPYPPHVHWAGMRAYNRWLVDFCAETPNRRAGLAVLDVRDIEAAVEEVAWAREAGLRGVFPPTGWWGQDLAPYYDERYEPLWSACEDHGMPVHFHGGPGSGDDHGAYGPKGLAVYAVETTLFYSTRAFPYFVLGGVLERHPGLQLVFTESQAPWLHLLAFLDRLTDERSGNDLFSHVRRDVPLRASEYFRRQVFLGASMMTREDALSRHEIGLENLMWGSDYPHVEGTWPRTNAWLQSALGGLPPDEVHTILAANPARLYGFDLDALQPIADRIGPTVDELAAPPMETLWEW